MKINRNLLACCFVLFICGHSYSQCSLLDLPFNGNANDVSGSLRHGVVHGATLATDRFGNKNSAYWFDGIDDFIRVDTSGLRNNTYSFSLWAKLSSQPISRNAYIAISLGQNGGDQQIIYMTDDLFGTYGWGCSSYSLGAAHDTDMGIHTDLTKWHHLVTTRNNNELKMYFDGELFGVIPIGGKTADYGSFAQVCIGARWGSIQFFHGFIDDVNIYGCELSSTEVKDLFEGDNIDPVKKDSVQIASVNVCQDIWAYPNPTFERVTIELCDTLENVSYKIESERGKIIKKEFVGKVDEILLYITDRAGVYTVTVKSNDILVNKTKIIKL